MNCKSQHHVNDLRAIERFQHKVAANCLFLETANTVYIYIYIFISLTVTCVVVCQQHRQQCYWSVFLSDQMDQMGALYCNTAPLEPELEPLNLPSDCPQHTSPKVTEENLRVEK